MRNDFTDQNNYLMHSSRGKERKNHKYLKREWVNGRWEYTYKGDSNTKSKSSSQSEFEEKAAKQRAESDAWYQNKLAESEKRQEENKREYEEKNGTYEERVAKQRAEYDALYQEKLAKQEKIAEEWDRETKEEIIKFVDAAEKPFKDMLNVAKKNNDALISKLEKNKKTAKIAGMMRTFSDSTFAAMETMMTSQFKLMKKLIDITH